MFVTNNTTWVGKTIADLYKSRWQIELFFKWIKQNLKVKRFVGRSKNAVLSQLWVATCMYLLLAYLKFVLRLSWTLHRMLQVLLLNLFDRRPLVELFTTPSPPGSPNPQMLSWPRTHTRRRPPVRRCRRRPRRPRTRRRFPYSAFCAAAFSGGFSPVFLSCQQRRPRSGSDT